MSKSQTPIDKKKKKKLIASLGQTPENNQWHWKQSAAFKDIGQSLIKCGNMSPFANWNKNKTSILSVLKCYVVDRYLLLVFF